MTFQSKLDALPPKPASQKAPGYFVDSIDFYHARLVLARELLVESRRGHRYCDDSWYSCPKTEDGCANEDEGDDCNCGADKWNAKIDAFLDKLYSEGL